MSSRISFVYASFGYGHEIAARSVGEAVAELDGDHAFEYVDILRYLPASVGPLLSFSYRTMASRTRPLWRLLYSASDNHATISAAQGAAFRLPRFADRGLVDLLFNHGRKIILCTHPFPAILATRSSAQNGHAPKIWSVVTDFRAHAGWACPKVDRFFVASDHAKHDLIRQGVSEAAIRVVGMPVRPSFRMCHDGVALRRQLGLDPAQFTVLLMPHWHNRRFAIDLLRRLRVLDLPIQVLVVAGRDAALLRLLKRADITPPAIVRGWVEDVPHLMAAADVVVTKPGGQTVGEAIACERPMILIDPIPGQEELNANFVHDLGLGKIARSADEAVLQLRAMVERPDECDQISPCERQRLGRRHRDAALSVARELLDATADSHH